MKDFLSRFGSNITGTLSGFDRLVFRGSLLPLMRKGGLHIFLGATGIQLLDFKKYALGVTDQVREAAHQEAKQLGRPDQFLESASVDKEDLARKLLKEHPVDEGLICSLSELEPCMTFEYRKSADPSQRGYRLRPGRCVHLYKYYMHPRFGFMHARLQTWFPFNVQIYINGREWLARRLDERHVDYERVDNCFTRIGDSKLAQRLMNGQLATNWPRMLDTLARDLNPLHSKIFELFPMDYYWTAYQTEWATDLMFKSAHILAELYPLLVRHAIEVFQSPDVLRFLGGKVNGNFKGEILSSFKDRPEGVRVKHYALGNSVKMYDKANSVLRVETTIGRTSPFKVLRPDAEGELKWQPMRKGVADLHRRAQVSQKANNDYLNALSAVDDSTPCSQLFDAVSRSLIIGNAHIRALRLNDPQDLALFKAVSRGEFTADGFRNRDITPILSPQALTADAALRRRFSSKTTRLFRMLRAHGIILKVPKSHRYRLTRRGHLLIAAIFAARSANIRDLKLAA